MVARYAYVNAIVGGMKSFLLEEQQYKVLIESTTLDDAFNFLKTSTHYGKKLGKVAGASIYEIELILFENLTEEYGKIIRALHKNARKFAEKYAEKCVINTVKSLIISKISGEKSDLLLIPYGNLSRETIEKLIELESVEEMIENLKFVGFYHILKENIAKTRESFYLLSAALDRYYYTNLYKTMQDLTKEDRSIIERLIGGEVDIKNLLLILRLRGSAEEEVWKLLIPQKYKLKDNELRIFFNTVKPEEIISQMPPNPYSEFIIRGIKRYKETNSFLSLEKELRKYLITSYKKCFYGERFNIGVPLAYLTLKENEIKNIIAILRGKEANLPPSEITKYLTL